ncbi:MAG TPA: alkylhydroperoxidase-related (seleno)protein, partial [Ilumatobacteraceae bacterium]|nr:alkylhydroperoxidase-related (seleno)protein [Ilumatobacteraceae bacterium]
MPSTIPSAVRSDLLEAQAAAWGHVTSPGASWTGAERRAIAQTAIAALDDTDPLPPWVSPTSVGRSTDVPLPDVVVDAVYRIARHASTLTDAWYRDQLERGIDVFAYVEMVGVVVAVAAVDGFFR